MTSEEILAKASAAVLGQSDPVTFIQDVLPDIINELDALRNKVNIMETRILDLEQENDELQNG